MKKLLLTLLASVFMFICNAQDSNILIGLNAPAYGVKIKPNWQNYNGGWARGYSIANNDNTENYFMLGALGSAKNGKTTFSYGYIGKSYSSPYMVFKKTGNVGIGTKNPKSKLTVNGKIHAKEVLVDLNIPADYVFEKYYNGKSDLKSDYTMPTLEEVASFTKKNNHLPAIPSAKEIKENGLKVGEMTNLLLQKIEELTLYTIEQQKAIKALKEEVNTLKSNTK